MINALGVSSGTFTYCLVLGAIATHLTWRFVRRWRRLRQPKFIQITPTELKRRLDAGYDLVVLDLRHSLDRLTTPYAIPGAIWISPDKLPANVLSEVRSRVVVFYCTSTKLAAAGKLARMLHQRGINRPLPLQGGLQAWKDAALPLECIDDLTVSTTSLPAAHAVRAVNEA